MSADEEKTPEEIEAEIEATREELGDTVAAAADKADVSKQAKKKAKEMADQAKSKAGEIKDAATDAASSSRFTGSGGDVGSGPTGDIRERDSPAPGHTGLMISGALLTGFVLGRLTARR